MFIEDQAFITSVDRKLHKAQLFAGLDEVVHHYTKKGIKVTWLHLDNEFKSYKTEMEKQWKLECNFAAPDEHVPDIECLNRIIQDCFRVKYHHLPFQVLPQPMIRHRAMGILVKWNMFPKKDDY